MPKDDESRDKTFMDTGNYSILKRLGSGGQSTVYLCKNRNTGDLLAMKVYRDSQSEAEREVEILRLLKGKGAPFLIDLIRTGGYTCIVMEYLEGMSLRDYLKEHPLTDADRAVRIAMNICSSLIPMHMNVPPFIYGDLKPENIMITKNGEAVLFDFGSVVRAGEKDRALFGTPDYMPDDDKEIGTERDVYALGVIMYEMLTGCKYKSGIKKGSADVSHFPSGLSRIMQKAVHLRSEERYKNASEFYMALRDFGPAGSEKTALAEPVKKKIKRRSIMNKRIKEKKNAYIAEVKRVALCSVVKGILLFFTIYFALNLVDGTIKTYASVGKQDKEIPQEEILIYSEKDDTYYDGYGRKVLIQKGSEDGFEYSVK